MGDSPAVGGLLTINTGSSSVKIAGYRNEPTLPPLFRLAVDRIGQPGTVVHVTEPRENAVENRSILAQGHGSAILSALEYAHRTFAFRTDAVGHRVVHGGGAHAAPERVTASLLADLRRRRRGGNRSALRIMEERQVPECRARRRRPSDPARERLQDRGTDRARTLD